MPTFPGAVPDLEQLLVNDPTANPPDKYKLLATSADWYTSFGFLGYFNAAIDEIYSTGLITNMFAHAATGKMTPEEALIQADQQVRKIFDKWRALGKV